MGRDIFEDIAARHLASQPGIFVKRNHNPGDIDWIAEIDILGLDLINKVVYIVEVKSGDVNSLISTFNKFEGEMIGRLKVQMRELGAKCGIEFATWDFRPLFYVKSSFQKKVLEARSASQQHWDVRNLEDALMLDGTDALAPI
jgi:hypothetical protein